MSGRKIQPKARYKALIVGAGRIASGFDSSRQPEILTHAHAYRANSHTQLAGFVDSNFGQARAAAKKWHTQAFRTLAEACSVVQPDIVSICTPDDTHASVLRDVLRYRPQIVICEKPLTRSVLEAEQMVARYKQARIPLLVNYSRRFDATVQALKHDLKRGRYGRAISATGIYSKGLVHNGLHMIDLARYLFGEVQGARALSSRQDASNVGKSVAAFLTFQRCKEFHLVVGDERCYSIFELDILTERGRIRLQNFGFELSWQAIQKDVRYAGFRALGKQTVKKTDLPYALSALIDNAVAHLTDQEPLICTGAEALKTERVGEALIQKGKFT